MKNKGISISGLAETNSNWHHKQLTRHIRANASNVFHNASVVFSENSFNPPDQASYLPGGTLQICTDHWTARIIETFHDPRSMGRWFGQRYRLKEGKTLSIITAYRPYNQSNNENTKTCITASYQQKLIYLKEHKKKINPRQLFMSDLIQEIKTIEKDPNNLCILMWDANESIDDRKGAIRKLITEPP
jgi:hypothetical protein